MPTLEMSDTAAAYELQKFKFLYLEHTPGLIFHACKYVDKDTAEDLVQDVFIRIWQKRQFPWEVEGIKTYLFRSVQNACLDYLRHQQIETTYVDVVIRKLKIEEIHYHSHQETLEREEEHLASIYREIGKLPDRCREVFTLAYLDDKKSSEIAEMLQISQRTVEAQLYKGLKTIRDVLAIVCLILFFR